ncbi:MAG: Re/Si-specific NAD(P)(+) transhydrogenase subunit alpha [Alphaproteobacteria bacterium]|nr:Re/Si-specific NAD(P)(+) transhydrogenase subunit alpha [Alphaproteobacteria bacterium]
MKIAILNEKRPHETRVAGSPEVVKKLIEMGLKVVVEKSAGVASSMPDGAFRDAGATIAKDAATALKGADIVLKVQRPMIAGDRTDELSKFSPGQTLICQMSARSEPEFVKALAKAGVTGFAMEMLPRISRAQSMDVLSSQSNLAGYKAVLDAASEFGRALPMMMTAAGTIPPARVLFMGVGVAGLQAIATARRLGAIVSATDVRPATKEQVESLGATFIAVEDEEFLEAQTAGGYAKEMSAEYQEKQRALIAETIKKQDIVICTALIPGRPAPVLVDEDMVKSMKPGSVIVDLAVEAGGNCPLSKLGKIVSKNNVKIVGHANVPGRLADDASKLYAKNLFNFLTPMMNGDGDTFKIDEEDEIIKGTLITLGGKIVNDAILAMQAQPAKAEAVSKTVSDDAGAGE